MPNLARATLLAVGLHAAFLTAPSRALAFPPGGAQPVPYQTAPVPYGQPPAAPAPQSAGTRALSLGPAQSVGSDVIYLRDGGILRGTIIDAIPNAQARIQLATGEIATVPWSEIARFDHAGATPPGPPQPHRTDASPEPNRTASAAVSGSGVLVHIDSPSPVELQRKVDPNAAARGSDGHANAKSGWQTVCSAPCDHAIPADGRYRVIGDGARPSREFMLPGTARSVSLNVSPSSPGWFIGGIVLTSVGGITMIVGLFVGLIGSLATTLDSSGTAQDWANGGWTAVAIGGVGMIVGIVALVGNMHSDVAIGTGEATGQTPGSAWAHVATWREASPIERAVAPAVAAPLIHLSF